MGPILLKKSLILIINHKIANEDIKGVQSQKKYFRGFATRTCLLLTPQIKKHTRENTWNISRNIYGIYKKCITNISIDIYDITINIYKYIHQTHRRRLRRRPNGAAAPLGLCV